jgi:hypothetical protein
VGYLGVISQPSKGFYFDFWEWFRICVKQLKIQPSEAWRMDFKEIQYLLEIERKTSPDLSVMLNYERIQNGASKEWLQKV